MSRILMNRKLRKCSCWFFFIFLFSFRSIGQVSTKAEVIVSPGMGTFSVNQELSYTNDAKDTLTEIYLQDWNHAFKDKDSPLGKHFSASYIRRFHFSSLTDRGETRIDGIWTPRQVDFQWKRLENQPDIIQVELPKNIAPGESIDLQLQYTLRIPDDKFTGFGISPEGDFNLRYWLILPAVYNQGWKLYSHKNLNDQYLPPTDIDVLFKIPPKYSLYTALTQEKKHSGPSYNEIHVFGKNRTNFDLVLRRESNFDQIDAQNLRVLSDIEGKDVPYVVREASVQRILKFLNHRLGDYPYARMLITDADYESSPIYGLNQLPDFLRPFSDSFQFDMKMLKTLMRNYLNTSLQVDLRKDDWILKSLQVYLMMEYVEEFYPNTKLIGNLSDVIGVRWTHLADLSFNERYPMFFMNMNRLNLDQKLAMPKDSLVKFNQEIANPFKAGVGLAYLKDFLGEEPVNTAVHDFYHTYRNKPASLANYEEVFKKHSPKDIDWFFEEYIKTNVRLDFKIKKVEKVGDSLRVTIKNKEPNSMPVSLYGIDEKTKTIVSKNWIEQAKGEREITIPRKNVTRLALNYEGVIPEINQRNNYKNLRSPFNKPLQFRLLKDAEDPHKSQVFFMPEFSYNLYDGFVLGSRISNQAILSKRFSYVITPQYGFKSKDIVGHINATYQQQFRNQNLSSITYGFAGDRYSYAPERFYYRSSPYVVLGWRHRDLRNKERNYLELRNVTVQRDRSEITDQTETPNYNIFNLRYQYSNQSMLDSYTSRVDYQIGQKFSKVSFTAKYRKLFLSNRQIEFRLFAGAFLYNHTDSDYFNFGLDRPTDYLFDYNYYGRSETSGLFSQQFIESEGGFKSILKPRFADAWLTSLNASLSLYRDVLYIYGDLGLLKNKNRATYMRYDSGIRLSLVQDYFEVFFPVYSNRGWEMGQDRYDQHIRFIVSLDFQTLMGLFTRSYY